jgi:hypothetical protein
MNMNSLTEHLNQMCNEWQETQEFLDGGGKVMPVNKLIEDIGRSDMRIGEAPKLAPLRNGNVEFDSRNAELKERLQMGGGRLTPEGTGESYAPLQKEFENKIQKVVDDGKPGKVCHVGKKPCDYFIKSTSADSFDMCGACSVQNQAMYHWDKCPYDNGDAEALWSEWYRVMELKKTTTNPEAKQVLMDVLKAGFVLKRKV